MQYASLPNAEQLAITARRDLVQVYALGGEPKRAYETFKPLAGDEVTAFKMLDDLGTLYLDTGHFDDAVVVYRDLKTRDHGPKGCTYQGHIAEAILAQKPFGEGLMRELLALVNGKCGNVAAEVVVEAAIARGDPSIFEMLLAAFKPAELAGFQFRRLEKEDWPTAPRIKYALAELQFRHKEWARCGAGFQGVLAEDPAGPLAADAAYGSFLCYRHVSTEKAAAVVFREMAMCPVDEELGAEAARLYVEALRARGRACVEDLKADVPVLIETYCKGEHAEACGALKSVTF
jgi:hypothetical protein